MKALERLFAEKLLKVKAVKIQPANPFTWASGWKSPIYCDNRKTLSYPALRNFVKLEICRVILEKFGEVDAIAGVATGAIAQGALVAEELKTQPYEDDTIMMGLKKTGEALAEAFQTLTQNFMKAVDGLSDIMEEWSRTLTKILEAIAEAARKIGH